MATAPQPVNTMLEIKRFLQGVDLYNGGQAAPKDDKARHSVATLLVQEPHLITELPLSQPDRDKLKAYSPPPGLVLPSSSARGIAPLTHAQHHNNMAAFRVIVQNHGEIMKLGLNKVNTSARLLRGSPAFNAHFLTSYSAGMLADETLRGTAIRAGQPDVDFKLAAAQESARDIGQRLGHTNVTTLPSFAPPAPPAARRRTSGGGYTI